MSATHPQAVQLKGVVGVGAGEEVVGEEEEEEHRKQEQTLHGLLWTVSECVKDVNCNLFTQILVGTSNGTDHFGLFRPEYSGPAFKMVHFDRYGHFDRSDRNVPFHLTKLLFPVPPFCILHTRIITKRAVAWVGSVQPECTTPLGT